MRFMNFIEKIENARQITVTMQGVVEVSLAMKDPVVRNRGEFVEIGCGDSLITFFEEDVLEMFSEGDTDFLEMTDGSVLSLTCR